MNRSNSQYILVIQPQRAPRRNAVFVNQVTLYPMTIAYATRIVDGSEYSFNSTADPTLIAAGHSVV